MSFMVSVAGVLSEVWLLFLLSLIASVLAFPFVFVFSFVYDFLSKRFSRTPRILLMVLVTFLAVLTAIVLLEVYVGFTLSQAAASFYPPAS